MLWAGLGVGFVVGCMCGAMGMAMAVQYYDRRHIIERIRRRGGTVAECRDLIQEYIRRRKLNRDD